MSARMAEDNKDLIDLLDKLKKMGPEDEKQEDSVAPKEIVPKNDKDDDLDIATIESLLPPPMKKEESIEPDIKKVVKEAQKAEKKMEAAQEVLENVEKTEKNAQKTIGKDVTKPKGGDILTDDIKKKIEAIESDIRTKEDKINIDLEKLDALLEALAEREGEMLEHEKMLKEKDELLSKQLSDMRKIREELSTVLK